MPLPQLSIPEWNAANNPQSTGAYNTPLGPAGLSNRPASLNPIFPPEGDVYGASQAQTKTQPSPADNLFPLPADTPPPAPANFHAGGNTDIFENLGIDMSQLPSGKRIRPDRATPVTKTSEISDAKSLLSYLKNQGVDVKQATSDPMDTNTTADFNTDQVTGDRAKELLRKVAADHEDTGAQVGYMRLPNGKTTVFFKAAGETSAKKTAADFVESLKDPGERAVFTQKFNADLEDVGKLNLHLAELKDKAGSTKAASEGLQSEVDGLKRDAKSATDYASRLDDDPQQQQYQLRKGQTIMAQARQAEAHLGEAKYNADSFLNQMKELEAQRDERMKAAPENAMAAVEQQKAKRFESDRVAQRNSELIKSRQPDTTLREIAGYTTLRNTSFDRMNKAYEDAQAAVPRDLAGLKDDPMGVKHKATAKAAAAKDENYKTFKAHYEAANRDLNIALHIPLDKAQTMRNEYLRRASAAKQDITDPKILNSIEEQIRQDFEKLNGGAGNGNSAGQ